MNSVRERATAVCDDLLRDDSVLSSGGDDPSGVVRRVLRSFADHGLLNTDLVNADTGAIPPEQLQSVATAAKVFSSRSFPIASVYMVNAVLIASCIANDGGGFHITGEKIYTTGASTADLILVLARVSGMGKRTPAVLRRFKSELLHARCA